MNMKRKMIVILSAAALALTLTSQAAFGASSAQGITRGEFFKQITDQLKLAPQNSATPLPKDVSENSEYANTVRVLIERGIIGGYEDGTFRTGQPITSQEADYVLGRFLGIQDTQAKEQLRSLFGVSLGEETTVDPNTAVNAIKTALTSDASAQALMEKSQEAQTKINSFSAHMIQEAQIRLRPNGSEALEAADPLKLSLESEVDFNKDKGMHIITSLITPAPGADGTMQMEQFLVPEGSFMKMADPVSKQPTWFNISKSLPFGFKDLMTMQQNSLELNKAFLNKSFFYRDLGNEQQDGKTLRKIGVYGKISTADDVGKVLESVVADKNMLSRLLQAPELRGMSVSMNGTIAVDERTGLVEQTTMNLTVQYPDTAPIDRMSMNITAVYKDYNADKTITLPDEAKSAQELAFPTALPDSESTVPAPTARQ
jgi:hypothetical protein